MTTQLTLELSEEIGFCCGELGSSMKGFYKFPDSQLDDAIIENYGFLLAYLCKEGGIGFDEAGSCIACFVGMHLNGNRDKFMYLAKSIDFYLRQLISLDKNGFIASSCICYNLLNPGTLIDFTESMPLESVDAIEMVYIWSRISAFLKGNLPHRINPILKKL